MPSLDIRPFEPLELSPPYLAENPHLEEQIPTRGHRLRPPNPRIPHDAKLPIPAAITLSPPTADARSGATDPTPQLSTFTALHTPGHRTPFSAEDRDGPTQ